MSTATMRIPGHVLEHATSGLHIASGDYLVHVLITDELSDRPYLAVRNMGTGPAASIAAERAANQLRAGVPVLVHCRGLKDYRFHQQWVRRAIDCDLIEHHAAIPHHTPAAERNQA